MWKYLPSLQCGLLWKEITSESEFIPLWITLIFDMINMQAKQIFVAKLVFF